MSAAPICCCPRGYAVASARVAVLAVAALAACGPPPPSASAWAAAGGPAPGASVDTGPDTKAAEALPTPPPAAPPPPRPAPTAPTAPAGDLFTYRGTIGGKKVVARITCGATCGGYYFFEDAGEAFQLRAVEGATFESTRGLGAEATVLGSLAFDAAPGKASWRGRFTAAGATAPVPVALTRVVPNGRPTFVRRTLADKSRKDAQCVVKVESFELVGLRDATLEWRINQGLSPESIARAHLQAAALDDGEKDEFDDSAGGAHIHCRMSMQSTGGCYLDATAKVIMIDDRLASITFHADDGSGGAHPILVVSGATVNLATGEVLDARDLIPEPSHEPAWGTLLTPTADLAKATASEKVEILYALGGAPDRIYAWSLWPWKTFYLTPRGVAFPPGVDEFHKPLREFVQVVPYAKAKSALRADGPAAYLWGGRPKKR